jgi:hypothetical protein
MNHFVVLLVPLYVPVLKLQGPEWFTLVELNFQEWSSQFHF